MKRIITLLLALLLVSLALVACGDTNPTEETTAPDATDEAPKSTFVLRIEGNSENLYYGRVPLGDNNNLQALLVEFDKTNDTVDIEGEENAYITKINNEVGGTYGGWDGWCVLVNGESLATGINDVTVEENDEVVIYYGDPWGVGMTFPEFEADTAHIVFSTAPNALNNGTVANMKVKIDGVEYRTDTNGNIFFETTLEKGTHTMQIELMSENGLCLALRYAPDFTFEIK